MVVEGAAEEAEEAVEDVGEDGQELLVLGDVGADAFDGGGRTASGFMTAISSAMSLKITRATAPSSMTRMAFSPCGMKTRS